MIALGLYLGGWLQVLTVLERAGAKFWHTIEPLGRRFLPVRGKAHALGLGLVWGWLPCGMVYAVLVWSLTAGGAP
ncbi:MAG: sulfite exporter TauE/SafE family protein, partial [Gammaproteobacteria bacterium]|nr:sulfite exporter TauE/SafE family protein [Gammaproteobacteria bacterium]NIT64966.1 sulfite exporter TauE/SafE family protein [Gammaproteobacteria bacterium]NIV21986.1 sulfite exporter TauE/SafE family protein [Gammaproteobacteria bacterium]NIY33545.1 sulfite exporter TauE/SafE family protein [Gammaproteobacteria bacterium]